MKTAGGPVSLMVAMVIVWGSVLVKLRRFGAVMAAMKVMAERRMVVKGLTRMHQLEEFHSYPHHIQKDKCICNRSLLEQHRYLHFDKGWGCKRHLPVEFHSYSHHIQKDKSMRNHSRLEQRRYLHFDKGWWNKRHLLVAFHSYPHHIQKDKCIRSHSRLDQHRYLHSDKGWGSKRHLLKYL